MVTICGPTTHDPNADLPRTRVGVSQAGHAPKERAQNLWTARLWEASVGRRDGEGLLGVNPGERLEKLDKAEPEKTNENFALLRDTINQLLGVLGKKGDGLMENLPSEDEKD